MEPKKNRTPMRRQKSMTKVVECDSLYPKLISARILVSYYFGEMISSLVASLQIPKIDRCIIADSPTYLGATIAVLLLV
jgi:hypothetical protein